MEATVTTVLGVLVVLLAYGAATGVALWPCLWAVALILVQM